MTELIPLRPLKTVKPRRSQKRSFKFKTAEPSSSSSSSDSSDDDSSSNDESPVVVKLQSKSSKSSKASKRKNTFQTLPLIINNQPAKQKKKHHRKNIQQFLINTQPPPSPQEKEILIQQFMEPSLPPQIQYVPVPSPRTPLMSVFERPSFGYPPFYSPPVIEESPYGLYRSYEPPARRIVRVPPLTTRSVHLPRHAKRIVNRFLSGMEHAHGHRYIDGSDSDCSIDDCRVCHRLRYEMNGRRRRSTSEMDLYRGSRVVFESQDPHNHNHRHSKNCNVCNLLEKSDFVISTTNDHRKTSTKKRGKHVHVVESFPSNIKPAVETTTTTTTSTQPKVVVNNPPVAIPSIPIHSAYYATYGDPNNGAAYTYDPNWQYNQPVAPVSYDYSSYYTNPAYTQSNPQYATYNPTVPVVPEPSTTQHIQTTKTISPNPLIDKGTYTHMQTKRKKHKPVNKTVIVHTSRNPTPPTPKIIIEQPRPRRLPHKLQSTTVLKEQTTQTPHTTTTTYVRT